MQPLRYTLIVRRHRLFPVKCGDFPGDCPLSSDFPLKTQNSRTQLISKGKSAARKLLHAHILLKADTTLNWTDHRIAEAIDVSLSTIERVRERFVEEGLSAALDRQAP
jgi:hypothetical protein